MIALPVIASWPRSGSHFLGALLLQCLGVPGAPWPENMREPEARQRYHRDFVPYIKHGRLTRFGLGGFVHTHDDAEPYVGPKVILIRDLTAIVSGYQRRGARPPAWVTSHANWIDFNTEWLRAGARAVWYEELLHDPIPAVNRVVRHLDL